MTGPTTLWSAAVESSGFAMVNQPHSLHTEQFNHFLHTQFTRNSMSSEGCRDRQTGNRDRQDMKGRERERERRAQSAHTIGPTACGSKVLPVLVQSQGGPRPVASPLPGWFCSLLLQRTIWQVTGRALQPSTEKNCVQDCCSQIVEYQGQTRNTRILKRKPLIDTSYCIWHRLELTYFHFAQFLLNAHQVAHQPWKSENW